MITELIMFWCGLGGKPDLKQFNRSEDMGSFVVRNETMAGERVLVAENQCGEKRIIHQDGSIEVVENGKERRNN